MSWIERHRKLLILIASALVILFLWLWLSLIHITNEQHVRISYVVGGTAGFASSGIIEPGESRYLPRLLTREGGFDVLITSGAERLCDTNVYVVPPLGGKCNITISPDMTTCECKLGL